jgi:thiol-disulfide isomerase/thioredoxin
VRLFNNAAKRSYYVVHDNTYRDLKPETNRRHLFDDVLGGPVMHFTQWLGDFLHGLSDTDGYCDVLSYEESGEAMYAIRTETDDYDMRLLMSKTDPPEIRRVEINLKPALAQRYASNPDTTIRLTAKLEGWRFNAPAPDELFTFNPPSGVTNVDEGRANPARQNTLEGNPAPDFTLEMLDGGSMQLSAHKGRHVVILDFWASWCGPCRTAMPIVARVAEQFKDKGVVLYAVNLRETPDRARAFLERANLSLKAPMDVTGAVAVKYGVTAIPRLILIDKNGVVAKVHPGMSPDLERQLVRDIQAVID